MIKVKSFLWMMAAAIAGGITMASCTSSDSGSGPSLPYRDNTPVDYTIMFYSAGGENLDKETENDLLKAAKALQAVDKQVRFMVQYKYSTQEGINKSYSGGDDVPCGVAGGLYRFELLPSHISQHGVLDYFKNDMLYGNQQSASQIYRADSITSFINYCQRNAPAKNYILMFSDHGAGYAVWDDFPKTRGIVSDKFHDGNPDISVCDIRTAIENSNMKHVKMINFDACLMNTLEVISEVADVTDYVMASSHISNGGNYTELVNYLRGVNDDAAFEKNMSDYLNGTIQGMYNTMNEGDTNSKYAAGENEKKRCDWALTNTAKFKAGVLPAMKAFTDKLVNEYNAGTLDQSKLEYAANNCYRPSVDNDLYDMGQYVTLLAKANPNLNAEATALKTAMENAQVCHYYTNQVNGDFNNMEYKRLTYTVNLGAKVNVGGEDVFVLRNGSPDNNKEIQCYDSNGLSFYYKVADGSWRLGTLDEANEKAAWENTYETTIFDKATKWSRWLKLNPYFPLNNPPFTLCK